MTSRTPPEPRAPDPLFDGHLERPLTAMTPTERLEWAWQMKLLADAGRGARRRPGPAPPPATSNAPSNAGT